VAPSCSEVETLREEKCQEEREAATSDEEPVDKAVLAPVREEKEEEEVHRIVRKEEELQQTERREERGGEEHGRSATASSSPMKRRDRDATMGAAGALEMRRPWGVEVSCGSGVPVDGTDRPSDDEWMAFCSTAAGRGRGGSLRKRRQTTEGGCGGPTGGTRATTKGEEGAGMPSPPIASAEESASTAGRAARGSAASEGRAWHLQGGDGPASVGLVAVGSALLSLPSATSFPSGGGGGESVSHQKTAPSCPLPTEAEDKGGREWTGPSSS